MRCSHRSTRYLWGTCLERWGGLPSTNRVTRTGVRRILGSSPTTWGTLAQRYLRVLRDLRRVRVMPLISGKPTERCVWWVRVSLRVRLKRADWRFVGPLINEASLEFASVKILAGSEGCVRALNRDLLTECARFSAYAFSASYGLALGARRCKRGKSAARNLQTTSGVHRLHESRPSLGVRTQTGACHRYGVCALDESRCAVGGTRERRSLLTPLITLTTRVTRRERDKHEVRSLPVTWNSPT